MYQFKSFEKTLQHLSAFLSGNFPTVYRAVFVRDWTAVNLVVLTLTLCQKTQILDFTTAMKHAVSSGQLSRVQTYFWLSKELHTIKYVQRLTTHWHWLRVAPGWISVDAHNVAIFLASNLERRNQYYRGPLTDSERKRFSMAYLSYWRKKWSWN